jgi:hypothetical protein
MTGWLQRLALRGAGLAPPEGPAPLQLRPRSAFEPSPPLPDLAAMEGPAPVGDAAADRLAAPAAEEPGPALRPSARPRHAAPPIEAKGASPESRAAAGRADAAPRPDPAHAASTAPARPVFGDPLSTRAAPAGRRGRAGAAARHRTAPAAEGPTESSADPIRGARLAAARASAEPRPPVPRDAIDLGPAETAAAAADALPHAPPAGEDPAQPFSLSIGRIDVEFVHPPAPPAAAPADPRTRGFADYARIRRGAPR